MDTPKLLLMYTTMACATFLYGAHHVWSMSVDPNFRIEADSEEATQRLRRNFLFATLYVALLNGIVWPLGLPYYLFMKKRLG